MDSSSSSSFTSFTSFTSASSHSSHSCVTNSSIICSNSLMHQPKRVGESGHPCLTLMVLVQKSKFLFSVHFGISHSHVFDKLLALFNLAP